MFFRTSRLSKSTPYKLAWLPTFNQGLFPPKTRPGEKKVDDDGQGGFGETMNLLALCAGAEGGGWIGLR